MNHKIFVGVVILMGIFSQLTVHADYTQELNDQIAELKNNFPEPRPEYFHNAGILVHKADDAALYEMASGMVRKLLFEKMKDYVTAQLNEINQLYATDAFQANRKLQELLKNDRLYEPTEAFLQTMSGQAILTEIVQVRDRAIKSFDSGCSDEALSLALTAIRQTGLFSTKSAAEIESLRTLDKTLACCLNWKPEIHFKRNQQFETDYEAGTIVEEAHLRLESSRTDLSAARWGGEFIYKFKGRDGEGKGVSQSIFTFRKGEDRAKLDITPSRVTSIGRMNFPQRLAGEARTLEIRGNPLTSTVYYYGEEVPLMGCPDIKK